MNILFTLSAEALKTALLLTGFAAGKENFRTSTYGIHVKYSHNEGVVFQTTDGHRASKYVLPNIAPDVVVHATEAGDFILPTSFVKQIMADFKPLKGKGVLQIVFQKAGDKIGLNGGAIGKTLAFTPEEGPYADIDRILPHEDNFTGAFEYEGVPRFNSTYLVDVFTAISKADESKAPYAGIDPNRKYIHSPAPSIAQDRWLYSHHHAHERLGGSLEKRI